MCMGAVLFAHPVLSEWRIQRNAKREVGTTSLPFYNDPHRSQTTPFCCDGKARATSAQSFTLWQQATIEITHRDHSIIVFLCHIYIVVVLFAHPVLSKSHIQRNAEREVATVT